MKNIFLTENQKKDIRKLSYLANIILESSDLNTPYLQNKNIIDYIFIQTTNWDKKEDVRLTIIDSKYSTNMDKRMYGIIDISNRLTKYSDNDLIENSILFLDNIHSLNKNKNIILELFLGLYGMQKGDPEAKSGAVSLISKYLFFLTKHNFPIYDSLIKLSLLQLFDYSKNKEFYTYFEYICFINKECGINNFNLLDNLLWLWGKINSGSYSLILDRNVYSNLIHSLDIKSIKSKEIDLEMKLKEKEIIKYLKNNSIEEFIEIKNRWK